MRLQCLIVLVRRLPSFHLVLLATLVSLIGLFGVGGGGASSADPADSTDPTDQPSDAASSGAAAAADSIPESPEGPTAEASALGVAEHEIAGIVVDLLDVSRTGDAITVRWRYHTGIEPGVTLSDDNDPYALTRGAYLLDETHQKKYLVLEDGAGRPVAAGHAHNTNDTNDAGVVVRADVPLTAWAKFPAPPGDVEQIAVHLPGVGPFETVPVAQQLRPLSAKRQATAGQDMNAAR